MSKLTPCKRNEVLTPSAPSTELYRRKYQNLVTTVPSKQDKRHHGQEGKAELLRSLRTQSGDFLEMNAANHHDARANSTTSVSCDTSQALSILRDPAGGWLIKPEAIENGGRIFWYTLGFATFAPRTIELCVSTVCLQQSLHSADGVFNRPREPVTVWQLKKRLKMMSESGHFCH